MCGAAIPAIGGALTGSFAGASAFTSAVSIIGTGLSIISTVSDFMGSNEAADSQVSAINQNVGFQQANLFNQQQEVNEKAKSDMSDIARQALIQKARFRAAAGESGVGGVSVDLGEREIGFQEGFDIARLESNRASSVFQLQNEMRGVQLSGQNRLDAVNSKRPSALGAGLQIAGSIFDTASSLSSHNNKVKDRLNAASV